MTPDRAPATSLAAFIDASPSPFHACAEAERRLTAAGFERVREEDAWPRQPGRYYLVRGGTLAAWCLPEAPRGDGKAFRVLGAHTDSPNLRVKPRPDSKHVGLRQLGVEVYGGVLLNSWLDRGLGLSGRVWVRGGDAPAGRLFRIDRPILVLPQLAIHLDREVNTEGLKLNPQTHMAPIWGLDDGTERGFRDLLASELDVAPDAIASWDAMCHDTTPSTLVGVDREFLAAPRLDNLCSCFAALEALVRRVAAGPPRHVPVVVLFDHEEVGSSSSRGAGSPVLRQLLERIVLGQGGDREAYHRAVAASVCASADMAHATHPNYVHKHEPDHHLAMNAGPVIKVNANLRYATEGETEAIFQDACERADVPYQKWVNRTDLACGSTIGPITASNLGMRTVDVGNAQLAMHSSRELCGSLDPAYMIRALESFLA